MLAWIIYITSATKNRLWLINLAYYRLCSWEIIRLVASVCLCVCLCKLYSRKSYKTQSQYTPIKNCWASLSWGFQLFCMSAVDIVSINDSVLFFCRERSLVNLKILKCKVTALQCVNVKEYQLFGKSSHLWQVFYGSLAIMPIHLGYFEGISWFFCTRVSKMPADWVVRKYCNWWTLQP